MILGTYWFFGFPNELYKYEYFSFKKGTSGFADSPAELTVNFESDESEEIISELKLLIELYNEGLIFIYQEGNKLQIGTGGFQLFDYDFLLIKEVEKIIKGKKIKIMPEQKLNNPIFFKLKNENSLNEIISPRKKIFQLVGSEMKKQNAENSKLRLDCNLNLKNKSKFISVLKTISIEENIEVFFYLDKDFKDKTNLFFKNRTNLMLFFTNGRQGLNLNKKKSIDIISFENKVERAILKFGVELGHINGYGLEFYPQGKPKFEMMVENEYII